MGQIPHEEAQDAQDKFVEEARKQAQYWEEVIGGYKAKMEEYQIARNTESARGMQKLIEEAETEKAKEEAKFMSDV